MIAEMGKHGDSFYMVKTNTSCGWSVSG
uniref:Uncharacterized protein n=1 Tax=Rhizophora mucronata TaxID=61149 RepID=A0A2P2NTA5_RHIMU